jgi:hypothetical protein
MHTMKTSSLMIDHTLQDLRSPDASSKIMKSILRKISYYCQAAVLIAIIGCLSASCRSSRDPEIDVFQEDTGFLQIPGVGWQTFLCTADKDNSLSSLHFKSGTAYYRWYWVSLEPQEGQYNFEMIDKLLALCRQNNQALAFRIMCEDPWGEGLPQWLIDKGIRRTYSKCPQEGAHYVPDMSDSVFLDYHEKLIRAIGERYDGHPDLALVDIGSVGLWGEWHIYCDPGLMPTREIRNRITNLYFEVFPNTPLTSLVDDTTNVKYAVGKGRCGWRGDSWGNAPAPGVVWNHHEYSYWPTYRRLPDAWKTGTIAMEPGEPGGTMIGWVAPVKNIVDDALAWHVTFAQNKSKDIPAADIPEIERLVMKMGFRLVLRNLTYNNIAIPGKVIPLNMKFENLGIAPPYRDHRIALRLTDEKNMKNAMVITDISIRGWLPGEINTSVNYQLPSDLKAGNYKLEIGLVFHNSIDHTIPLANLGKTTDGWYSVGNLKVGI